MKNTIENQLKAKFNPKNYSSLQVGDYLDVEAGAFCLMAKPNLYQPIDSRYWEFEQVEDEDGEPFIDGPTFKIKDDE